MAVEVEVEAGADYLGFQNVIYQGKYRALPSKNIHHQNPVPREPTALEQELGLETQVER